MSKVLIATLPVLFPLFFISGLLIEFNILKKRGVTIASYFTGFPTSARMISILFERGEITRREAVILASKTSVTSPAFIILSLGLSMYGDIRLGILICIAHTIGAILNGHIYKLINFGDMRRGSGATAKPPDFAKIVQKTLQNSTKNTLKIGVFIAFFYVFSTYFGTIFAAILEMTTGVFRAEPLLGRDIWRAIIPCAIVSFGGLSVALQGQIFLKPIGIKLWLYLTFKATQTVISIFVCAALYIATLPLW